MCRTLEIRVIAIYIIMSAIKCFSAESSTCLSVYNEGGAPAVFQSPKCPRWKLSDNRSPPRNAKCQVAVHQGRRRFQEDRIVCALDIRIPFPGPTGLMEVAVGVVAVFDGHNGSEASDMASNLLLEYLILHTYFLLDATFPSFLKKSLGRLSDKDVMTFSSQLLKSRLFQQERFIHTPLESLYESFHLEILREALLRTMADIDSRFSKEAYKYNLDSGSTATVVLMVDDQILVANLGDSKALLCSEKYQSPADAKATAVRMYMQKRREGAILRLKDCESCKMVTSEAAPHLMANELTRDHRPDRDDEKSRVENAGGYVSEWSGVHRVNGRLTVSRAIGDVSFKRFGVSSAPEVTDWQVLNVNDSYLVAASDGIFEVMDTQDVCDLLWEVRNDDLSGSQISSTCSDTLADCIVNTAFKRGSMDNMAVAVVPLRSTAEEVSTGLVHLEYAYPFLAKFDRLLIEGKYGYFGCYYLYEKLKETGDMLSQDEDDEMLDDDYDTPYALPGHFDHSCGESVGLNEENNFCFHFGMISDGNGDDRGYPEDFSSFLSLLESIPPQHAGSNFGSFERTEPKSRYVLRKRFGRGAYGEVWLAFQWNCSHEENASKNQKDRTSSKYHFNLESRDDISGGFSSSDSCPDGSSDNKLFILKRIMVERGSAVYLSGLREKHFGEIFLNASTSLGGFSSSQSTFWNHSETYANGFFQRAKVVVQETSDSESTEDTFIHGNRTWTAVYEEGLDHIARYMESFESQSNEIWLVFRHEGISLSKLMYTAEDAYEISSGRAGHAQVLHPSKWWHWLKTTKAGQEEMQNLIWQLLMALKSCHDRNITHRDIKPENMVVCIVDPDTSGCLKGSPPNKELERGGRMRIIDFGSAVDDFTMRHLYGSKGPSRAEQTHGYSPPEALLNISWFQGQSSRNLKYDMWSVGVVFLEILLGSPDVFQISTLSHALLDKLLEGWNEDLKELAYRLRSFMEMCILVPGLSTHDQVKGSPASWKCSEEFFSNLIKNRDPLNLGFPNVWAMRLVRQLLRWDPDDRLSVDEALQHPYFSTSF